MASDMLLPLFPLQLVLFPGAELPIHIFEPRYREMVGEAIEQESEFGVILVQGEKLCSIGCTAIVEKVTERFNDGRFNIVTRGRQRFRAIELDKGKEYLRAEVEFIQDMDDEPAPASLLAKARTIVTDVAAVLDVEAPLELGGDDRPASFAIASPLPLDLLFKQQLLEQRSERQRMSALVDHLEALLLQTRVTKRMQKLAGTNGHGRREIE